MTNTRDVAGFLVVQNPPELVAKMPFYFGNNVIGRTEAKASIVIKEASISQKHASLYVTSGRITLTDLGSKNGTKINSEDNLL